MRRCSGVWSVEDRLDAVRWLLRRQEGEPDALDRGLPDLTVVHLLALPHGVAGAQLYRMSSSEFPGAYFRTLKIHHNAQITSRFAGGSSEEFAGLFVFSMGAVRKIQSSDIHTGQQQLLHHFKGVGTGPDGADYLGASGG